MKKWTCRLLAGLAWVSFAGGAEAAPTAAQGDLYIVVLEEPSVSEKVVEWTPGMSWRERRGTLFGAAAARHRKLLESRQDGVVRLATRAPAGSSPVGERFVVTGRDTLLLNALFVRTDAGQAEAMRSWPGVKGVFPNRTVEPLMDAAPDFLGAPQVWELLGGISQAGLGMRIGVIDSGIDVSHPMFQDDTLTAPAGFPQPATASPYTNSKVIVARNYVSRTYGLEDEPNPVDARGHGSAVAGIAAGRQVAAPLGTVRGMAPRAYLGNYRVFGSPAKNPFATDASIIAALRDAVSDGMDVVNMSLGGDARDPSTDPEQIAIANAARLGVVVVIAAGNLGGNGAGTVTSPGTSPDAITVGSTSHPRLFGNPIEVSSGQSEVPADLRSFVQIPGSGQPIAGRFGPAPLASIRPLDNGELACEGLPAGSLRGKVALVRRGTCLFSTKAANVLGSAEAAAMVVYNNLPGPPFRMDFGEQPPSRPAVMIDMTRGEALRELLLDGASLEVVLGGPSEVASSLFEGPLFVSDFSGRGPAIDLGVKPDLSAPGESLYTATINPNGTGAVFSNPAATRGTSFATPIVSGAAALLMQLHPNWSVAQVKSALVNRADSNVSTRGRAAKITETGAGRLDLVRAASTTVFADPVSLGYGFFDEEGGRRTLTLTNLGPAAVTLRPELAGSSPVAELGGLPTQLTLQPGESRPLEIFVRPGGLSGTLEGTLRVRDQSGAVQLAIPYFGVAVLRGGAQTLLVSKSGPAPYQTLREALGAAMPGDVVEIDDDSSYLEPVTVHLNSDGIPLDGLTLRAGSGRRPVIDATQEQGRPALLLEGVKRVHVEGLTVRSAGFGAQLVDASATLKNNTFLTQVSEQPADLIRAEDSRLHLYGNTLSDAARNGISLFGSAALVQNNRLLSSAGDGLAAVAGGPSALFDNRLEGTAGVGIRSTDSTLLAKANQILGAARSFSDGVRVEGTRGRLAMIDNLVAGCGRAGVAASGGAEVSLLGDVVQGCATTGLSLASATGNAQAVRFLNNASGARVFLGDLTLTNSLIAQSTGPGVDFVEGILNLEHSTLADNAGFGLAMGEGSLDGLRVSNSIFRGNLEGDLQRGDGGEFRFSLFESLPPTGPGNLQGDPRFADAAAGDYSPQSPDAIDAGDPAIESGLDLNFHRRVVDGNQDQRERIDIGAIEAGSAWAPSVLLPILSPSPRNFVGLAMANGYRSPSQPITATQDGASRILMRAFDVEGVPFGRAFSSDISAGSQLAILLNDAIGPLQDGWVEIQPDERDLLAFTLVGGESLRYLDGAQLASTLSRTLLFPEGPPEGGNAWIYLINPHPQSQNFRVRWVRPNGETAETELPIPARGSFVESVRSLLGEGVGGYLTVEAELPLYGMQLFGDNSRRAGLLALDPAAAATDLYGAQLASSPDVETVVHLVNLGGDTPVQITARDENGNVIASVSGALPSGGQLQAAARSLFGFRESSVVGWLEVHSDSPLAGTVVFGDQAGRFLASLPLQSAGAREFYLSHVAQTEELFTGLTLLNTGSEPALVSVEIFTGDGARSGEAFFDLAAGQKLARLLTEILGDDFRQAGGFVRVRANVPVIGFQLFGGYSLQYLSAVPSQVTVP